MSGTGSVSGVIEMGGAARWRAKARAGVRAAFAVPGARREVFRDGLFALAMALTCALYGVKHAGGGGGDGPAPPTPWDPSGVLIVGGGPAEPRGPVAVWLGLALIAYLALALRRRFPLAVLWTAIVTTALIPSDSPRLTFYALAITVYTATAHSTHRRATLPSLLVAMILVSYAWKSDEWNIIPDQLAPLFVLLPIALTANGLRTWKQRSTEGASRLATLEREQAEALRAAVADERARIARELHDVVTHNVSVMVIQAGAARKILAKNPEGATQALLAVEAGGRAAMTELRHVMGLLTADGLAQGDEDAADDLAPQPGLDHIPPLVGRLRQAGLPVELTTTGTPGTDVSPGIGLAAYRVVQEALTNTVKHARGARASVTVDHSPDVLRVEVTDTGGTPGAAAATGNGRGLIGLRERLAVYGGTLHTGARLTGGYRVEARIPLLTSTETP
ncbi:histidine kinase [Streptomyces sp. NPDC052225]|uniref:sensor histidine kinase n=1 Tax=Streptomyces sp. NPDC052225 TaxID=3154949 RepID=UPI00342DF3B5